MALSLAHTRCFTAKQTPQALCIPPRPRAVAARVAGGAPTGWTAHHHRAADAAAHDAAISPSRRGFFAITVGGGVYLMTKPALAAEGASNTFLGYSLQPDLYLGQGYQLAMNYKDAPKYKFEYPSDWEESPVSKTDKSTMGMDGMVVDPASRGRTKAFVVALGGKDYEMAHLTDTTSTLRAMAGGDPDLREAVSNASAVSASVKKIQGVETYCYEIEGDKAHYLAKVAQKDGTIFGMFASTPLAAWERNEKGLRMIYDSFTLL